MHPLTDSLIKSCSKASNLLQRDYFELEILQNSRNTHAFCNKSFIRTKNLLSEELQKHSCPIYSLDDNFDLSSEFDTIILIDPLEGMSNFIKALPFFAIAVYYLKKTQGGFVIQHLIVNFPSLHETYYIERAGGVWSEKSSSHIANKHTRLRVSKFDQIENAIVGTNCLKELRNSKLQIRNFGSFYYHIMLFAAGKLDILYINSLTFVQRLAFESVIIESGGKFEEINSDTLVAGNNIAGFRQL